MTPKAKNNPDTQRKYFVKNKEQIMRAQKKWKDANRDKVRGYKKAFNERNPAKVEEKNFRTKVFFLRKVDLTFDEFKAMLEAQEHKCAICGKEETLKHQSGTVRLLCIDHDHKTNKVRGLLCQKCNSAIGFFNDDPAFILKAVEYLQKYANA